MGGSRNVARLLGLMIVAVLIVAGIGWMAIFSGLEAPQIDVYYVFVPLAVLATVGMIVLWAIIAIVIRLRERNSDRESQA